MNFLLDILVKIVSLYMGLTTSLFTMSWLGSEGASFYARLMAAYACLLACSIFGFITAIILRLVGNYRITQWATARAFKYTMKYSTGVEFEIISGKQHLQTRPCVFVGNHQTELDVLYLGEVFPKFCVVTSKKSLKSVPFLGWFMALSGTVFIDRKDRTMALAAFREAAEEMKRERISVFIFPEGTRSYSKKAELLDFKKGAFHLAIQAGVPVVPVVVCNYWGLLGPSERRFRPGKIPVIVLPPIPTDKLAASDAEDLCKYARDTMLRELIRLSESPRGQRASNPAYKPRQPSTPIPAAALAPISPSSPSSASPSTSSPLLSSSSSETTFAPSSSSSPRSTSTSTSASSTSQSKPPQRPSSLSTSTDAANTNGAVEEIKQSEITDTGVTDDAVLQETITPTPSKGRKESDLRKASMMTAMRKEGKGDLLEGGS
ncbi:hypothetical protein MMC25_006493 [Agyrium rufum]|nr:hypothetical protein [Agyrium rufum]